MPSQPKDNFSAQAGAYAIYRPQYPKPLYDFLYGLVKEYGTAWDCATGNGQVAAVLSQKFQKVYATDISEAQLALAPRFKNITYLRCPAEQTPLLSQSIDLLTVAQAVHWFDFDAFYREAQRVLKPGAIVAIWGYGLLQSQDETIHNLVKHFYTQTVGPYWDAERDYIDQKYTSIPFPFPEIKSPEFRIEVTWTRHQFIGYLSSWSSVQHYMKKKGHSPLPELETLLQPLWADEELKMLRFPVFLRVGRHPGISYSGIL